MADGQTFQSATLHHHDRTAEGIARSFADAGRDVPAGVAEQLAARIARDGGMQRALAARDLTVRFSSLTEEDRWLGELVYAESDADNPRTALAPLLQVLTLADSPIHPGARDRDFTRAARLLARIDEISVDAARAKLGAWVDAQLSAARAA